VSHLGDRVTALVDGQLPADATDRAMAHLASCGSCREAVELERLTKQRLASLATPPPGDALMARLIHMSGPAGPVPPRPGHVPGSPRPGMLSAPGRPAGRTDATGPAPWAAGPARPGRRVPVPRTARTRVAAAVVGAACLVGVGVAGGSVAVSARHAPRVDPPVADFMREHSETTRSLPFGESSFLGAGAGR
jgi:anti-sigma factor RsiW